MQKGVKDATHTVIFSSTKNIMGKTGFGPPKPGTLEGTHIQCFEKNIIGNANALMTVIFPNNDIFLRDQSFKSLLILSILDM
jgi:hypothetical protein